MHMYVRHHAMTYKQVGEARESAQIGCCKEFGLLSRYYIRPYLLRLRIKHIYSQVKVPQLSLGVSM